MAPSKGEIARRVLPAAIFDPIHRARSRRYRQGKALDLRPLELLQQAPLDELRDPVALAELLPRMGFNDEALEEFPEHLVPYTGQGLRHWQYPIQFAPYLTTVAGQGVRAYMEIGVRHGGTFVLTTSYLERFGPVRKAIACDLFDSPFIRRYVRSRPAMTFVRDDSRSAEFAALVEREGPFDLVLIDGDHEEPGAQADLDLIRPHARMIVMHDIVSGICPDVGVVWRRFRESGAGEWDFHEFTAQYDEVVARRGETSMGLGLAIRRSC